MASFTTSFFLHNLLVIQSDIFGYSAEVYEHFMAPSCNSYQKDIECRQRVILAQHSDMRVRWFYVIWRCIL